MTAWVRALLVSLSAWLYPGTRFPSDVWEDSEAIARAAERAGISAEGDGEARELALELAVLFATEGHFDPRAVGRDQFGKSYGGWQVHETTLRVYASRDPLLDALSDEELRFDVRWSALLAADLVVESRRVCWSHPPEERLAWYASGGPGCSVPEGLEASRRRMGIARRLAEEHPYFWNAAILWVDRSPEWFPRRSGKT